MFDLAGKCALVTGGSRGIGRSVALCLAEAGADVVLWGRDREALAATRDEAAKHGTQVSFEAFDIGDAAAVTRGVAGAIARHGKIDIAVVNAGVNKLKPFLDWTPAEWDQMFATNLDGSLNTLQSVGRHMAERKSGSVITMSSIYSFFGAPGNSIYCATKGALFMVSRCLAIEWARYNVRVNAICPGWIETDLTTPYMQDEKTIAAGLKGIPLRRFGKPEDIGPLAVYLAADESAWVTGQSFVIDGGQTAR